MEPTEDLRVAVIAEQPNSDIEPHHDFGWALPARPFLQAAFANFGAEEAAVNRFFKQAIRSRPIDVPCFGEG